MEILIKVTTDMFSRESLQQSKALKIPNQYLFGMKNATSLMYGAYRSPGSMWSGLVIKPILAQLCFKLFPAVVIVYTRCERMPPTKKIKP